MIPTFSAGKMSLLPLFFLLCLNTIGQDIKKIRIDPAQAYGGNVSEFFSEVNYVPLETTKESLFGDIGTLVVTDSSFVISDVDTRSVLFFSKAGKFITKIKMKDNVFPNISFDEAGNKLSMAVYNDLKMQFDITYYTSLGKLIGKGNLDIRERSMDNMYVLGDGYFASISNCYFEPEKAPKDSVIHLVNIYRNKDKYKSFIPVNPSKRMVFCALFGGIRGLYPSAQPGTMFFATMMDHDVYQLDKDSAKHLFRMVFPMNRTFSPKVAASTDQKYIDSLRRVSWRDEQAIIAVSNIFLSNDVLFFKINTASASFSTSTENNKLFNFIYNLRSGRLSAFERISPDSTNGYLPLYGWRVGMSGVPFSKGYFYSHVSALQLFTAKEANKERNPVYPATMQRFFQDDTRKSNPVIVLLKPKAL